MIRLEDIQDKDTLQSVLQRLIIDHNNLEWRMEREIAELKQALEKKVSSYQDLFWGIK